MGTRTMAEVKTPVSSLNDQLLLAANKGTVQEVKHLLDKGADPCYDHNPPGVWGSQDRKSPLHQAIIRRDECRKGVIRALIDAKADANAVQSNYDWRGCGSSVSAFEMVLNECLSDADMLSLFLSAGANPNKMCETSRHSMRTDSHGVSFPLHRVARSPAASGTACAAALLESKADVNARATEQMQNERGYGEDSSHTALHLAAQVGSCDMLKLLLAHGADINAVSRHLDNVNTGLESPTDDPRSNEWVNSIKLVPVKETALAIAIRKGYVDVVQLPLLHGADASICRVYGTEKQSCELLCAGSEAMLA